MALDSGTFKFWTVQDMLVSIPQEDAAELGKTINITKDMPQLPFKEALKHLGLYSLESRRLLEVFQVTEVLGKMDAELGSTR